MSLPQYTTANEWGLTEHHPNDYVDQWYSEHPNLIRLKEFISEECVSVKSAWQCLQLYTTLRRIIDHMSEDVSIFIFIANGYTAQRSYVAVHMFICL